MVKRRLQPRHDRYGRYLIPDPANGNAKAWTRATTISKVLSDEYHLKLYAMRMVAKGIGMREDLYALANATPIDDKNTLNDLCSQAQAAVAERAKANLGSALHAFTERVDKGETLAVPEPWNSDVTAYTTALHDHGVTIEANMIERIVTLHGLGIAGTFDRLVRMPGRSLPLIADLKTGGYLGWQEFAIQFAIYANADSLYDLQTQKHEPFPTVDKDQALVIHLPVGTAKCDLYLIDIKSGWEAVQHAMWVRKWQKRKDLHAPVLPPSPQGALPLAGQQP